MEQQVPGVIVATCVASRLAREQRIGSRISLALHATRKAINTLRTKTSEEEYEERKRSLEQEQPLEVLEKPVTCAESVRLGIQNYTAKCCTQNHINYPR